MSERNWPVPIYFADKDPVYAGNQKELDKATKSVKEGGLGGSEIYIHREFPRDIYDSNGGIKRVHDAHQLRIAIEEGWSTDPPEPKVETSSNKVQTQVEYEMQVRLAKQESEIANLKDTLGEMMQLVREKSIHDAEPKPTRGRPARIPVSA